MEACREAIRQKQPDQRLYPSVGGLSAMSVWALTRPRCHHRRHRRVPVGHTRAEALDQD